MHFRLCFSCVILLVSCTETETLVSVFHKNEIKLKTKHGVTYRSGNPFSGRVINLKGLDTVSVSEYLNGKEHGIWKSFYPNRQLKTKRSFKNGRKTDQFLAWWSNGNKKFVFQFEQNEHHGTCLKWFETGEKLSEMNYSFGHEKGLQQLWYANGKLKSNYIIKNKRRFGLLGTKNCVNVKGVITDKP